MRSGNGSNQFSCHSHGYHRASSERRRAALTRGSLVGDRKIEYFLNDLKKIRTAGERIAKIIKAMRTYSREAEADPFERTNLADIVRDTLELCKERFGTDGIQIELDCVTHVVANYRPAQLSQVLMNLLSNSYDAIKVRNLKWIKVKTCKDDGVAKIYVIDAGTGIEKNIVEKMMNPFFTTKTVDQGTGLGLSLCKAIMEIHSGQLLYSDAEPNTTFVTSLPSIEEDTKGLTASR